MLFRSICSHLQVKHLLSTAYHPQTDGQTESLNQTLEIALRAYVNEDLSNWSVLLPGFTLAYNSTPHSSTGFSPSFLLRGFHPRTPSDFYLNPTTSHSVNHTVLKNKPLIPFNQEFLDPEALEFTEDFLFYRTCAKEALKLAQDYQKKFYNEHHRDSEFQEGDMVLINLHSLHLLRSFKGRGQKLLPRFDGPYEVTEKVSKVAYRLRLPASYRGHPVINIAHLKLYTKSPDLSISRPTFAPLRKSFDELEEFEVKQILDSKLV